MEFERYEADHPRYPPPQVGHWTWHHTGGRRYACVIIAVKWVGPTHFIEGHRGNEYPHADGYECTLQLVSRDEFVAAIKKRQQEWTSCTTEEAIQILETMESPGAVFATEEEMMITVQTPVATPLVQGWLDAAGVGDVEAQQADMGLMSPQELEMCRLIRLHTQLAYRGYTQLACPCGAGRIEGLDRETEQPACTACCRNLWRPPARRK